MELAESQILPQEEEISDPEIKAWFEEKSLQIRAEFGAKIKELDLRINERNLQQEKK